MSKKIHISCDRSERDLPQVRHLPSSLPVDGLIVEFASASGPIPYANIERAIDGCDIFVAVIGAGYANSTWLNHELGYAYGLDRESLGRRPRLVGMRQGCYEMARCSARIRKGWLDGGGYDLILG